MTPRILSLKKDKDFPIQNGHPWVYQNALRELPNDVVTGEEVVIATCKGMLLRRGFVDLSSPILVRIVEGPYDVPISEQIPKIIMDAIGYRKRIFCTSLTDGYRIFHGEADGIPGLVVDRYDKALSIQLYSVGLEPYLQIIISTLKRRLSDEIQWIWARNQVRQAQALSKGLMHGKDFPGSVTFCENGLLFNADLVNGQKTGFFLDQRENRALIRSISKGLRVGNICGYTGAFSIAALAGGARETVTVDLSPQSLEMVRHNLSLNKFPANADSQVCADMYEYLSSKQRSKFDLVILDPPAFAKSRRDLSRALNAYQQLNRLAMNHVAPGGFLFSASCSAQVKRDDFLEAIRRAAQQGNKSIKIISETHHPLDHPIKLSHPEGCYLKGFLLSVR